MTKQGESPPVDVRAARAMARRIIEHHFGEKPKRTKHEAGGLSNFVFLVNHAECDFVVRISPDPAKINDFIKEQWAMTKAREVGVPTPEILKVGNEVVPYPYMVSQRVAGRAATFHPHREEILREMGRYAALINSVSTNGFGGTFDWSSNQLSLNATWGEFLHKELKFEKRMQTLEKQRMLSPPRLKKLRTILERVAGSRHRATLNHGDIRLKNMIVDDDGCIAAVIDWEHCTSNLSPPWELSLALHDLSIDEKQEFLAGYGLREKNLIEIAPVIKALNIINYVPEIERLIESKDVAQIEQYRTRLSGALDLYLLDS